MLKMHRIILKIARVSRICRMEWNSIVRLTHTTGTLTGTVRYYAGRLFGMTDTDTHYRYPDRYRILLTLLLVKNG
jgi:hypothetical protein